VSSSCPQISQITPIQSLWTAIGVGREAVTGETRGYAAPSIAVVPSARQLA
jgi:hypothetical protein